jgi:hypothetical protein
MCATSVIFKQLPKANNLSLGEDSSNLVTLFVVLKESRAEGF